MIEANNLKILELKNISFNEIKKLDPHLLGLIKDKSTNIYRYKSKPFKLLKLKISPRMDFLISFEKNELLIKLVKLEIMGFEKILNNLIIDIDIKIHGDKYCLVKRNIYLRLIEKKGFFKTIPEKVISQLFKRTIEILSIRLDKKLKQKLIESIS